MVPWPLMAMPHHASRSGSCTGKNAGHGSRQLLNAVAKALNRALASSCAEGQKLSSPPAKSKSVGQDGSAADRKTFAVPGANA